MTAQKLVIFGTIRATHVLKQTPMRVRVQASNATRVEMDSQLIIAPTLPVAHKTIATPAFVASLIIGLPL